MSNDGVKYVRPISSCRRTFTHDLLNIVNRIFAAGAIEAVALALCCLFCCSRSFTPFTPHKSPVKYPIYIAELTNCGIERVASHRESFICASEQFRSNILAFYIQCEFAIERIAVSKPPDADAFTARCYLLIRVDGCLQIILRPYVDAVRNEAATVVQIDRPERIIIGQDITDAVSAAGLHRCQRRSIICPRSRIVRAGVPIGLQRHEGRFLPLAVRPLCQSPHCPLLALD